MSTQTKIVCLIPSLSLGGAERQMTYLIQFFNENGIRPTVVTYYQGQDYIQNLGMNRIQISGTYFTRYIKIIRSIKQEKPNVILSYTWMPNVLAIISSFFCRKAKLIVSERGTILKYNLTKRILFNLYRRADVVVVNSNSQAGFIKRHVAFLCPKLETITNYTDINQFTFQIKPKDAILKVGIFARYHPQKNVERFLEAVKIFNQKYPHQMEFYWYGSLYGSEYYKYCDDIRKEYALDNVHLNNFVDNVAEIIQKMSAICLPSIYEGFSNALSEAICAGKPVLASNVCDNPIFVRDNENGFVFEPYDSADMAKAFEKLILLNNDHFATFQKNSRELASMLFSKEKFISSYFKIILD